MSRVFVLEEAHKRCTAQEHGLPASIIRLEEPITKDMQCRHCGKRLALLTRLTGGEFCSAAHKKSYEEEYSRLAFSRLIEAQSRPEKTKEDSQPPERDFAPVAKKAPAGNGKRSRCRGNGRGG